MKKYIKLLSFAALLAGCDPYSDYYNKSDIYLYNKAYKYLKSSQYQTAAKVFLDVDALHPSSEWGGKAILMAAYCYYADSSPYSITTDYYDQAIDTFEIFLRLNPHHELTAYATYMIGMCYFERLGDPERNQQKGVQAISYFNQVITHFPDSIYAKDAKIKVEAIHRNVALKNYYIAKKEFEGGNYLGAIPRLKKAMLSQHLPKERKDEARSYLKQAYKKFNIHDIDVDKIER